MKHLTLTALVFFLGCCDCNQKRFIPISGTELALDTKTGQQCWAGPKETTFKAPNRPDQPYCVDLAAQK
jgi:hypothetical protein